MGNSAWSEILKGKFRWAAPAALVAVLGTGVSAQQAPLPADTGRGTVPGATGLADVTMDPDGALHFGPRTMPPNMAASPESRAAFVDRIKDRLAADEKPSAELQDAIAAVLRRYDMAPTDPAVHDRARRELVTRRTLQLYPDVQRIQTTIAGVRVEDWKPMHIAPRNLHRVALEFEIDPEGVQMAGIGKLEVISVHYGNGSPNAAGVKDVVKVYRELLKTHKAKQIAMFGISGGCQIAANTTVYLHYLHLPMPGALGLSTCAGGDGDSRVLMNGVDPALSVWPDAHRAPAPAQPAPARASAAEPPTPGIPNRIWEAEIPPGFPPSYLISGTRDMALSGTVRLQRMLRHAGAVVDLNVFDGLWHGFQQLPELPESKDAITDQWHFFDKYLAT